MENLLIKMKEESEKAELEEILNTQEILYNSYKKRQKVPEHVDPERVGGRALLVAARSGLLQLTHLLVKVGAVPVDTIVDVTGATTALHQAASHGNSVCVALLLSLGANPQQPDTYQQTPQHLAAMFGHTNTYELLSEHQTGEEPTCRAGTTASETMANFASYLAMYNKCGDSARTFLKLEERENSTEATNNLLKGIDLKELMLEAQRVKIDFNCSEEKGVKDTVMKELRDLMDKVADMDNIYKGSVALLGSSADGTKLYAPDEFDVNVVLQNVAGVSVKVIKQSKSEAAHSGHKLRIEVATDNPNLQQNTLISNLYDVMVKCLITYEVQDQRLSIVPPGLTRTQVGVALSLAWKGTKYPLLLIGVDIVPVVAVPWHDDICRPPLTPEGISLMHLSNTGKGAWRCSFANLEVMVLKELEPEEQQVLLLGKTLLSCLKAEPWMPNHKKTFYTWWSVRPWKIPVPAGFCLKNAFLKKLEEKREKGIQWHERDTIKIVADIFKSMCQDFKEPKDDKWKLIPAKTYPYFGGDCEGPKIGNGAPVIVNYLNRHLSYQFCGLKKGFLCK